MFERALELGINYFDTGSEYWGSEERLGNIVPTYRDRIILSTKMDSRTTEAAKVEFERSLTRLKTDYIDFLCIHDLNNNDNITDIGNGVWQWMHQLKDEGTVKYIGFSSMQSATKSKEFLDTLDPDACIMAITPTGYGDYAGIALPSARAKNVGVIAMKLFRDIVGSAGTPAELLTWGLTKDGVAAAVVGHIGMATLNQNADIVKGMETGIKWDPTSLEKRCKRLAGPHALCWARSDYKDNGLPYRGGLFA
jgi:predicted aldo/keto reductase-like oxidoreductase